MRLFLVSKIKIQQGFKIECVKIKVVILNEKK